MSKPNWKDAPQWANHLWGQGEGAPFAWSATKNEYSKALLTHEKDFEENRFHLWLHCWDYMGPRP